MQFENEVDSVAEAKRLARCEVAQLFLTLCDRIFLWPDYFCGLIFLVAYFFVAELFLWPDYFDYFSSAPKYFPQQIILSLRLATFKSALDF